MEGCGLIHLCFFKRFGLGSLCCGRKLATQKKNKPESSFPVPPEPDNTGAALSHTDVIAANVKLTHVCRVSSSELEDVKPAKVAMGRSQQSIPAVGMGWHAQYRQTWVLLLPRTSQAACASAVAVACTPDALKASGVGRSAMGDAWPLWVCSIG